MAGRRCAGSCRAVLVLHAVRVWSSGICFALSAFRPRHDLSGILARRPSSGAELDRNGSASPRRLASSGVTQRRYGGNIVHVGIVLMFLGFAGQGYEQIEQWSL